LAEITGVLLKTAFQAAAASVVQLCMDGLEGSRAPDSMPCDEVDREPEDASNGEFSSGF
jgi:hypothetical protein